LSHQSLDLREVPGLMKTAPGEPKCDGISRSREPISEEIKILVRVGDKDPERVWIDLISPDVPVERSGGGHKSGTVGGRGAIGAEIVPSVS